MLKIEFGSPLTALEIRDPAIAVCEKVAGNFELYTTFHQPQQQAFTRSVARGAKHKRIGNGKHKTWHIDYQPDHPSTSNPRVVGRIILASPHIPEEMRFGGFDYGEYGKPSPLYEFITVHIPRELGHFNPIDIDPEMLEMTYAGLIARFNNYEPRIF